MRRFVGRGEKSKEPGDSWYPEENLSSTLNLPKNLDSNINLKCI